MVVLTSMVRDPFSSTARYERGTAGMDGAVGRSINISRDSCQQANEPPMPAAAADSGTERDRWDENEMKTTTGAIRFIFPIDAHTHPQ